MPRTAKIAFPLMLYHIISRGNHRDQYEWELRQEKFPVFRAKISFQLIYKFGVSMAEIARHLGVCTSAVAKVVRKIETKQKR